MTSHLQCEEIFWLNWFRFAIKINWKNILFVSNWKIFGYGIIIISFVERDFERLTLVSNFIDFFRLIYFSFFFFDSFGGNFRGKIIKYFMEKIGERSTKFCLDFKIHWNSIKCDKIVQLLHSLVLIYF